ncbi:MAG: YopX family protein [Bacillus sp. (in: firmicutes)]
MNVYELSCKALTMAGTWVEGLVQLKVVDDEIVPTIGGQRIQEKTLCRFVGRNDGTFRKVYEGDIFMYDHEDYGLIPAVVLWDDERLAYVFEMSYVTSSGEVYVLDRRLLADTELAYTDVIGNVHSTPEKRYWVA